MALALVLVAGCGSSSSAPASQGDSSSASESKAELQSFSAACSASGGAFNVVGTGWCTVMNKVFNGVYAFTAETTGGATANTSLIETGECQFGFGGTSSTYEAYNASADWTGGQKLVKSRVMWPMYSQSLTCFALSSSGITSWSDLEGKTVGLGAKGGGIDSILRQLLPAMGITCNYHNDTYTNEISAMKDGTIDAMVTMAAGAWPSLSELEATNEVNLLALTDEQCDIIIKMMPYYSKSAIPAGTYKCNADKDIQSCAQWAFAICSVDVDEETVYNLVKATFENYDDMIAVYAGLANGLKLENIPNMPFVFHDGAIKYYQEQGITMAAIADGFAVPTK